MTSFMKERKILKKFPTNCVKRIIKNRKDSLPLFFLYLENIGGIIGKTGQKKQIFSMKQFARFILIGKNPHFY